MIPIKNRVALPGLYIRDEPLLKKDGKGPMIAAGSSNAEAALIANSNRVLQRRKQLNDNVTGDSPSKPAEESEDEEAMIKARAILEMKNSYGVVSNGGTWTGEGVKGVHEQD